MSSICDGLAAYVIHQLAKGLDYAHRKTDDYGAQRYTIQNGSFSMIPAKVPRSLTPEVSRLESRLSTVRSAPNGSIALLG